MKSFHLLLVEDNAGDILLTTEALEESNLISSIKVVEDGQTAIDYVLKKDSFKNVMSPDLILLDVNLPFRNGHEVLSELKRNKASKHIPVIMLSTSSSGKDIRKAYNNYANAYLTKPIDADDFLEIIRTIESFWLKRAKLPSVANAE